MNIHGETSLFTRKLSLFLATTVFAYHKHGCHRGDGELQLDNLRLYTEKQLVILMWHTAIFKKNQQDLHV